jgi:exoribonuclease-2
MDKIPGQGSLVLYKNRPARVESAGDKLEIELQGGERQRVRPKDVVLLHPGPLRSFSQLRPPAGEVAEAWEILAGQTTDLAELSELIYGAYTPASAWAAWQLVDDGLYFRGAPDAIVVRAPEQVATERASRETEAAGRQAWAAFVQRARAGRVPPEDRPYLQSVEKLALGQSAGDRLLRALGREETPESAHALLLELGAWDHTVVPYPRRLGVITATPVAELPELPEEPRTDLTHLAAFAIDDEGNQEPDDAVSLEGDRLWVHVADVAALAPPDSPPDLEARARGATLYLPNGKAPMLPAEAVQRLGLGLAEVSPALSFGMDLGTAGEIRGLEIARSWVRVTRLTYEQVETRLEEDPFHALYGLAQARQTRRWAQGAILLELPEVQISVEDGEVIIRPLPPLQSRNLVLEAMLMAGEATARYASEHGIPFPFTAQDPPDTDERPADLASMYALRRSLKPSRYQTVAGPHAGLGLELYAQVTSPLRRYLDLVAHQQLRAHLRGEPLLEAQALIERVGAAAAAGQAVRRAERLAERHWTLVYLRQHPDWRGKGVLVDKRDRRATLLVPELDLEAQVTLRKDLALNRVLPVTVQGVDLPQLTVYLKVAG